VTTSTDYILTMVRISGDSAGTPNADNKGPILLVTGATGDGLSWFDANDPTSPVLPERLFDDGYDVWFVNRRGTTHSKGHVTLDADAAADAEAYWNWNS